MDKITTILVDALKQALAEPREQRLFKSGKLTGLFASRGGANGDAAAQALREGLIEVVRSEVKGKTTIEWVCITPCGVDFLHDHESPIRALEELRDTLRTAQEGVPVWVAEMRRHLQQVDARLTEDSQRLLHRLETLSQRVEEALHRLDLAGSHAPDGVAVLVPWAQEALAYLDRRRMGGAGDCPLPELFAALAERHPDLSVQVFHDGLRRLHERRALRLKPFSAAADELPQAEYALFDGTAVLYYATR